jgi:hypothetical protein
MTGDFPPPPASLFYTSAAAACVTRQFRYVAAVRSSSRWGGHVELQAAANATRMPITVISATAADRVVVPAPSSPRAAVCGEGRAALISFHQRQFFAGEHYNSVEPAL